MATRGQLIIDDTDSRIRYSGQGWFQDYGSQDNIGHWGQTYKHTSHGTKRNDSLSFSFEGTSIALVGTTQLKSLDDLGKHWDPSWECFVDKFSIGSTPPYWSNANNWFLCRATILDNGPHTLDLKVRTTSGATFWVDYLLYSPSPQTSIDRAVAALRVENTDLGVNLDSNWVAFKDELNMTTVKGAQARFDFVGKRVTWFGFVPAELPHAPASGSYSIDGGASTSFKLNSPPADGSSAYNQAFFTTPDLDIGPHTLIVTYDGAEGPATPLTLDYLFINGPLKNIAPSTVFGATSSVPPTSIKSSTQRGSSSARSTVVGASSTTSSGPPTSISSNTQRGSSSARSTVVGASSTTSSGSPTSINSNTQRGSSSSSLIRPIVGGVVGGVTVVLIICVFLLRRHRQRRKISENNPEGDANANAVAPFMSTYPTSPSASQPDDGYKTSSSNSLPPLLPVRRPGLGGLPMIMDSPNGVGGVDESRLSRMPTEVNVRPVLHEDSGVRFAAREDGIMEDIPPVYTAN